LSEIPRVLTYSVRAYFVRVIRRRRVEERALHLGRHAIDDARAYLTTALQRAGHLLQECVAAFHRQRPGGGEDGVQLGVG
jgi:hypothetical protein